jgi:hypothetical protein
MSVDDMSHACQLSGFPNIPYSTRGMCRPCDAIPATLDPMTTQFKLSSGQNNVKENKTVELCFVLLSLVHFNSHYLCRPKLVI